ncbi:MAG: stage II sporulation protein M [Cytophagales bacterium]|nr:stage II sporulation protein M [Armatimonadota bacterium]
MAIGAVGDFVRRRKPAWDTLSALILRTGTASGIRSLSHAELKMLGPLYRRTAADLAYARLRGADPSLVQYLNDLVLRAHGLLYAERGPGAASLWQFIKVGFPRMLRKRQGYILLAALLFFLGGLLGAGLTLANPNNGHLFLGERADDVDFYKNLPTEMQDPERPFFATSLMQNNIKVAILAFAVGVLGAVPTLAILFYNGLPIGALAVLQHRAGYDVILWSFLLPHGVPELSAIFIAGGAGMLIGHAFVAPGELSRRDALVVAGQDAVRLLFGTVMLLIIAGFIESFISPTALPAWAKFTFAAFGALALWAYVRSGKENDPVGMPPVRP